MQIKEALSVLAERQDLSRDDMTSVMTEVMSGAATDAQIGALLMALRIKGETIDEIAAAAAVMRSLARSVPVSGDNLVDLVGTGGDGANLFNVSTAATFVVAAAGAQVAKHGNRSVSSTSGSSDVLEMLGAPLDLTPAEVARAIQEVGVGFMFAPAYHSAMRHAVGPRRELGLRTLFNVLGPLTNPAGVKRQVVGVFDAALCVPLAEALKTLGSVHVMVVHGDGGLDEVALSGPTRVAELRNGQVRSYEIAPSDFGLQAQALDGLSVTSAEESAALIRAALGGRVSAQKAADLIALNAGATIYVSGIADSIENGVSMAEDLIATGQAGEKLKAFVDFTRLMREERS
ncbi:MAG: anthranilate phosphoribosyltransferase [Chromatocurvus sp.]